MTQFVYQGSRFRIQPGLGYLPEHRAEVYTRCRCEYVGIDAFALTRTVETHGAGIDDTGNLAVTIERADIAAVGIPPKPIAVTRGVAIQRSEQLG